MPNIQNLNKLFVRVATGSNYTIVDVSTESVKPANQKKIYFIEDEKTIVNNGVAYGINPATAQSLEDLIAVVGQSVLTETGDFSDLTVIKRLQRLEALEVSTGSENYLSITNLDNSTGNPSIGIKVVSIETISDQATEPVGLVDAVNAKRYIDQEVAKATSKVEVGTGLKLDVSANADNSSTYKVSPDFVLEYIAADSVTDTSAYIVLKDTNNTSVFGHIPVSDIIGNGLLNDTSYNPNTGLLTLYFNTAEEGVNKTETVDLHAMLDINDMSIEQNSQKYLTVDLTGTGEDNNSQAIFTVHTADVSTVTEGTTALADAWEVKQYVDSKSTDLAVEAEGDTYVEASVDANNNKKVNVSTNIATITVTSGTASTDTIADDGTRTRVADAISGTLSTTDSSMLLDASQALAAVKTYVDGEIAIEAKERELAVEAAIKGLDSENTSTGTNVTVNASIVDGELVTLGVTEVYADVQGTRTAPAVNDTPATPANIVITTSTGLVTGNDLSTLIDYTNDRIQESLTAQSISGTGDSYVSLDVSTTDNKQLVAKANIGSFTVAKDGNNDTTITAEADKLADAGAVATNVSNYVEARLDEEIDKLDSVINKKDNAEYVSVSTGIVNGILSDASSAVSVQYGSFETNDASLGIAKTQDVQKFVDTYDFWETLN